MRKVVIDNASLTSVQRLKGKIQIHNLNVVNNDLLAFENYIQAILFYDEIYCFDDYIEKFRKGRSREFEGINFIDESAVDYQKLMSDAEKLTESIVLKVEGGFITNEEFKSFFERVGFTYTFTWDMASSAYFLTPKLFMEEEEKNNSYLQSFHSQVDNETFLKNQSKLHSRGANPQLYDRQEKEIIYDRKTGKIIEGEFDGLSKKFVHYVSSLNWLAKRTTQYFLLSKDLGANLLLQPIRQGFLYEIISKINKQYSNSITNNLVHKLNGKTESALKNIVENLHSPVELEVELPFFSAYLSNNTKSIDEVIEKAYVIREKPEFKQARSHLNVLDKLIEEEKRGKLAKEVNEVVSEIDSVLAKIKTKYMLGNAQGIALSKLKFLWSWVPLGEYIKIPNALDFQVKELEFVKHLLPSRGFKGVYRNAIEDMIQFDTLGKYKDNLISNINIHEDATKYDIRTELKDYQYASSYWKKPM